ncbi:hypothetical protein [Bacillus mycoides]
MKHEHAITLDELALSLGELILTFQNKEITEPIKSRFLHTYVYNFLIKKNRRNSISIMEKNTYQVFIDSYYC